MRLPASQDIPTVLLKSRRFYDKITKKAGFSPQATYAYPKCRRQGRKTLRQKEVFMLKLILGRAGFGKSRRIRELIEQTGKDSGGQILIVPEQFSFETERAAAEFKGKKREL